VYYIETQSPDQLTVPCWLFIVSPSGVMCCAVESSGVVFVVCLVVLCCIVLSCLVLSCVWSCLVSCGVAECAQLVKV